MKPRKPIRRSAMIATRKRPRRKRKSTLAAAKRKLWAVFSAFIKARDGNTCVSCGAAGLEGQNWHAGHLFSAGQYAAIRYDERNVRSQCGRCNVFLRGNVHAYIAATPPAIYSDLDARKAEPKQWRVPEIEALTEVYREKLSALSIGAAA